MSESEFRVKPAVDVEKSKEPKRPDQHQQTMLTLAKLIGRDIKASPCGDSFQSGAKALRFARYLNSGAIKL